MEGTRKFTFIINGKLRDFREILRRKKLVISVEPLDIYTVPLMSQPSKNVSVYFM
jgi:hypothetical protein